MSCASLRAAEVRPPPGELSALDLTLRALRPLSANPEVTELCINRPREIFVETRSGWRREQLPFADLDWCRRLAKLVANVTRQRIDESSPLLSACAAVRRARADRTAAGDHAGLRRHHHPPAG